MANPLVEPTFVFHDDLRAPDIYADDFSGILGLHGNMRLTLYSSRSSQVSVGEPVNNVVIGRLVMLWSQAANMAQHILTLVEQHRVDPPPPPPGNQSGLSSPISERPSPVLGRMISRVLNLVQALILAALAFWLVFHSPYRAEPTEWYRAEGGEPESE